MSRHTVNYTSCETFFAVIFFCTKSGRMPIINIIYSRATCHFQNVNPNNIRGLNMQHKSEFQTELNAWLQRCDWKDIPLNFFVDTEIDDTDYEDDLEEENSHKKAKIVDYYPVNNSLVPSCIYPLKQPEEEPVCRDLPECINDLPNLIHIKLPSPRERIIRYTKPSIQFNQCKYLTPRRPTTKPSQYSVFSI